MSNNKHDGFDSEIIFCIDLGSILSHRCKKKKKSLHRKNLIKGEQWVIFLCPEKQHSTDVELGTETGVWVLRENPTNLGGWWVIWMGLSNHLPRWTRNIPWKSRLQLLMAKYLSDVSWRMKRPKAKPGGVKEEEDPGLFRRKWYLPGGSDARQALTHLVFHVLSVHGFLCCWQFRSFPF